MESVEGNVKWQTGQYQLMNEYNPYIHVCDDLSRFSKFCGLQGLLVQRNAHALHQR